MASADEEAMEGVGEALGRKRPRAPSVRYLWEEKAADAVLEFLRTTRVGCVGIGRVPPEDRGDDEEGEEGGPGPPRMCLSFVFFLLADGEAFSLFVCFFLTVGGVGVPL